VSAKVNASLGILQFVDTHCPGTPRCATCELWVGQARGMCMWMVSDVVFRARQVVTADDMNRMALLASVVS